MKQVTHSCFGAIGAALTVPEVAVITIDKASARVVIINIEFSTA